MSDAKRQRIRKALERTWSGPVQQSRQAERRRASARSRRSSTSPRVVPNVQMAGKAILDGKSEDVQASSVAPESPLLRATA